MAWAILERTDLIKDDERYGRLSSLRLTYVTKVVDMLDTVRRLTVYNYFIPFCATVKTITHEVLWMTRCTVARGRRPRANSASGHPQHRGGDSFDCCTERYEIVVLLPNSEDTWYWKYFLKFE